MEPSNMLELEKLVLENVSEDQSLFEKELRKSFKFLTEEDLTNLYVWSIEKFNNRYQSLIKFVFSGC